MTDLFLDDERNPQDVTWVYIGPGPFDIVRTQKEFEEYLLQNGIPEFITFDNDLGPDAGSGIDCVKWMIEAVLDGTLSVPASFAWQVHSMNIPARQYIDELIYGFRRFLLSEGK